MKNLHGKVSIIIRVDGDGGGGGGVVVAADAAHTNGAPATDVAENAAHANVGGTNKLI